MSLSGLYLIIRRLRTMGKGKGTYWTTLCCLLPWYASALLSQHTSDDFCFKANQSQSSLPSTVRPCVFSWPSKLRAIKLSLLYGPQNWGDACMKPTWPMQEQRLAQFQIIVDKSSGCLQWFLAICSASHSLSICHVACCKLHNNSSTTH